MKLDEDGKKLVSKPWVPKIEEKIDFINNKNPIIATVTNVVQKDGDSYVITVSFIAENDSTTIIEVPFPSSKIFKCGEKLTARTDCMSKI